MSAAIALALQQVGPGSGAAAGAPPARLGGSPLLWGGFFGVVLVLLALDLFVINRRARDIRMREAALAGTGWVVLALLFCGFVFVRLGAKPAAEFLTGYVVELSLSFDNLFVFLVLFRFFRVEQQHQHRVLFWGILGALVMRAAFILLGIEIVQRWRGVAYLFGFFLLFTGIKLLTKGDEQVDPAKNLVLRGARRLLPVTTTPHGGRFFLVEGGRRCATTLFLCLLTVEASDVVFAVDSIPAIFGITLDPFIVYTSNVFAILGLRSFFMLLALLMAAFRYLNVGLAVVLIFIGAKMLASEWIHVATGVSLAVVLGTLAIAIVASLLHRGPKPPESAPPA